MVSSGEHNFFAPIVESRRDTRPRSHLLSAMMGLVLCGCLYALVYYPYEPTSFGYQVLFAYLQKTAWATASIVGLFEPGVAARATVIASRFPIEIVLDCAALDIMIVYLCAVVSYPSRRIYRLRGAILGVALILLGNLFRLVALCFIGIHAPSYFHVCHEEVFQIFLVALTLVTFWVWRPVGNTPR